MTTSRLGGGIAAHPAAGPALDLEVDVVVIGAGLIGCAVTYGLSRAGYHVALIDKGKVCSGASSANFGRIQIQDSESGAPLDLAMRSAAMFPSFLAGLGFDVEYEPSGALMVAQTPAEWDALVEAQQPKCRQGLDVRLLGSDDARVVEPYLDAGWVCGASYSPNEGQLNPMLYTMALAARSVEMGVKALEDCSVEGFDVSGGRLAGVITSRGRVRCGAAVLCAGAWSHAVGKKAGLELPVEFVMGEALITESLPRIVSGYFCLASFFETAHSTGQAVSACCTQTRSGNMLVGEATVKMRGDALPAAEDERRRNTHFAPRAIAREVLRFFPTIAQANVIRTWRTFAPFTSDHRPVLGMSRKLDGLAVCAGFKSTVVVTPLLSWLVVDLLKHGNRAIPREIAHGCTF